MVVGAKRVVVRRRAWAVELEEDEVCKTWTSMLRREVV